MSTIKVNTLTTLNGLGNITVSRPLSGSGASLTDLPAANLTGTLPALDGSNLTGVAPTQATIEALGIELPAANLTGTVADARFPATLPAVSGANLTGISAGKVLQVQYSELLTTIGTNSTAFTDTGLSVTITPTSASNYLLITPTVECSNGSSTYACRIQVYISGGGTAGAVGNGTGVAGSGGSSRTSAVKCISGGPLPSGAHGHNRFSGVVRVRANDSVPNWSSGALTIKVQYSTNHASHQARINWANGSDTTIYSANSSQLIVMEIEG